MLRIGKDFKNETSSGFLLDVCYLKSHRSSVLLGIFKRVQWYFSKKHVCLGVVFINFNGIIDLIKGRF